MANISRMKSALAALLTAMALASGGVPATAAPQAELVKGAFAFVDLKPRGGVVPHIGIFIQEARSSEGTRAWFTVFRGECRQGSTDMGGCMISSSGFATGTLDDTEYQINGSLQSAWTKFTRKGKTYEMVWEATTNGQADAFETYCESGEPSVGAGGGFAADAKGFLRDKTGRVNIAGIDTFAYASTCTE